MEAQKLSKQERKVLRRQEQQQAVVASQKVGGMKWLIAVGLAVVVGVWLIASRPPKQPASSEQYLTPVSSLADAHGLAADVADPSKLYIASHHGLFLLKDEKDLYRVGPGQDDYMGFSPHPTDSNIFFTSGHPAGGGNLGFQKTEDGAKSWNQVGAGAGGQLVDFHAMAVDQIDPNLAYGYFRGSLQKSTDGGQNWQMLSTNPGQIISLTADPKTKGTIYASTTQGIKVSRDAAASWSDMSQSLSGAVTVLVLNPANAQEMLAYSQGQTLVKSTDAGQTWSKVSGFSGGVMLHMNYSKVTSGLVYGIAQDTSIHKSTDGGAVWNKIR